MMDEDKKYEHESYGVFGINRISGTMHLFGSEATHHSALRIHITPASMTRSLNHEWIHTHGAPYIEIDMSASAYVAAIANPNSGEGQPCTIRYVMGKRMADPPEPESTQSKFGDDIKRVLGDSVKQLDSVAAQLKEALLPGAKALNKTEQKALLSAIESAIQGVKSNLPYVEESFDEHMEIKTDKMKTEMEALRDHMYGQLGQIAAAIKFQKDGLPELAANMPEIDAGRALPAKKEGE